MMSKEELKRILDDLFSMYKSEEIHAIKHKHNRDRWEMYGAKDAIRRVKAELEID